MKRLVHSVNHILAKIADKSLDVIKDNGYGISTVIDNLGRATIKLYNNDINRLHERADVYEPYIINIRRIPKRELRFDDKITREKWFVSGGVKIESHYTLLSNLGINRSNDPVFHGLLDAFLSRKLDYIFYRRLKDVLQIHAVFIGYTEDISTVYDFDVRSKELLNGKNKW